MILSGIVNKDELHKANNREIKRLSERLYSDDFSDAIANFTKKKMLKNKL